MRARSALIHRYAGMLVEIYFFHSFYFECVAGGGEKETRHVKSNERIPKSDLSPVHLFDQRRCTFCVPIPINIGIDLSKNRLERRVYPPRLVNSI